MDERSGLDRWLPPPVDAPPDGYVWALLPDPDWETVEPAADRLCRMRTGSRPVVCLELGVAILWRRHGGGRRPWSYCRDHLYGRTIWRGRVAGWVLRPVAPGRLVCGGRVFDDLGADTGWRCRNYLRRRMVYEGPDCNRPELWGEMATRARSPLGWAVPDSDPRLAMCPSCRRPVGGQL